MPPQCEEFLLVQGRKFRSDGVIPRAQLELRV
jgi:hypothetical protein